MLTLYEPMDTEIAQEVLRLLKPTDMTIHWKALEEHFLMVPLFCSVLPFGSDAFSDFFSPKISVFDELTFAFNNSYSFLICFHNLSLLHSSPIIALFLKTW
jgi:hypothetical protein